MFSLQPLQPYLPCLLPPCASDALNFSRPASSVQQLLTHVHAAQTASCPSCFLPNSWLTSMSLLPGSLPWASPFLLNWVRREGGREGRRRSRREEREKIGCSKQFPQGDYRSLYTVAHKILHDLDSWSLSDLIPFCSTLALSLPHSGLLDVCYGHIPGHSALGALHWGCSSFRYLFAFLLPLTSLKYSLSLYTLTFRPSIYYTPCPVLLILLTLFKFVFFSIVPINHFLIDLLLFAVYFQTPCRI